MKYIPNYQRVISTGTEGATSCQRLIEQRLSNDFKKLTRITLALLGQACNPIYSEHWGRKIKSSMKTPGERERNGGGKREQGPGLYPQQKTKLTPVFTTRYIRPFLIYVYGCVARVYVCTPYPMPIEVKSPATGITDSCERPCGCWEPNLGHLEEQDTLNHWATSPGPVRVLLLIHG